MVDLSFQGLVPFPATVVKLAFEPDYTPGKGKFAGQNMGPVVFMNTTGKDKIPHASVADAIKAVIKSRDGGGKDALPTDVQVYVDNGYHSPEDALALDLSPYVYKFNGYAPGYKVQFLTDATVLATNSKKGKHKNAKKAVKATTKKGQRLY
jgi:hypothetical protein